MHSEKRTKLRKPSNLLLQIPFDSSRVDRVAEKGGYILTLNKEMFVWLMASDKSIAQWLARFVRDEEAGGSSPLTPTIFNLLSSRLWQLFRYFCHFLGSSHVESRK